MNQEDIKLVLSFCKVDLKYFEVSKVFEAIYISQVYTPEVVNRLFRIACYTDQDFKFKDLIDKDHINYWNSNLPYYNSLCIDWKLFKKMNFSYCGLLVTYSVSGIRTVRYYKNSTILNEDALFGFEFIDYFKCIQDKFVKLKNKNRWIYNLSGTESYEVRYASDPTSLVHRHLSAPEGNGYPDEFVAMIDYKRRRYLIIGSIGSYASIACNTFGLSIRSYSCLLIREYKDKSDIELRTVLNKVKSYYHYCNRLKESSN